MDLGSALNSIMEYDIKKHCHINTNEDGDRFVGIKADSDNAMVYFPIGYELPETDAEIRTDIKHLIQVLSEFTTKDDRLLAINKFAAPQTVDFPINAYKSVIEYYFSIGGTYYVEKEQVYITAPTGKQDWARTARKQMPLVQSRNGVSSSNTSHIKMDTYHARLQSAEFSARIMKLGCYLFMAVVGLIGFMNMANTMIMNIMTKKQEYGGLQAVGMTNKQLNLCLQLQGLIFTVGTICVALIVGLPLGYALFAYAKHNGIFGMNVYHVPITPILAMILLVSLLQIVLSLVLSSNLKKETLVERIRYQG